jgi:Flp pilus assembly protein protease CpaA
MDHWVGPVTSGVFLVTLAAAAVWDLKFRRIPNLLTVSGLLVALMMRGIQGASPLIDGVIGAGVAALVSLPLFSLGALGGGDGKLLIAIGGFMGPVRLAGAFLMIALVGGVLGVLDAYRRGLLVPVILNSLDLVKHWATLGRRGRRVALSMPGAVTIPYGVAIAVGAVLWWFWGARIG